MWLRILSVALEKELKVLDYAYWLNCSCFVLSDWFSLLWHFLVPSFKLILWVKFFFFFHRQKAGRGHSVCGGDRCKDHSVPLHFKLTLSSWSHLVVRFFLVSSYCSSPWHQVRMKTSVLSNSSICGYIYGVNIIFNSKGCTRLFPLCIFSPQWSFSLLPW